ncbi:hypothetical protein AB0K51_34125 [Kitasatospora sp. NPDC049285]|uniref:BACON domain-containing protein n=1 Tax=Kitasatospora sp. NPDC049285 TaxID=3157096 RepID=UPI003423061F
MTPSHPSPVGPSPLLRAYAASVDGLFTYCLSVLCEHEAATTAVTEVRDLALRHGDRLTDPALQRAWLYALARHRCLARLERAGDAPPSPPRPAVSPSLARERRRELASLAWPEAAGTDPEQREALELAVRHRLAAEEVAAVLGLAAPDAAALLDAAGAEVGRTRTALLVLGVGSCPELAQLGGVGAESWRGWVLGPALRRELVLHLVECPTCRGTAERVAGQLGHGLAGLPGLPLLSAPVRVRLGVGAADRLPSGSAGAAFLSGAAAGHRAAQAGPGEEPRFDQRGFPRHRAPAPVRGSAVRQRMVTTGVLAAVLAAPVVALWGAHRDGGAGRPAAAVSSVRVDSPDAAAPAGGPAPDVPAAALPPAVGTLELAGAVAAETSLPTVQGPAVPVPSHGSARLSSPTLAAEPSRPAAPAPAQLTVEAGEYGNRTVLTLTNSGGSPLAWHAVMDVDWLRLSRDSGTLAPGQRITVTVTVDETRAPQTQWTARLALPPSTAVVTLEGGPDHRGLPTPDPTPTDPATPTPQPTPTSSGTPTPDPSPTPEPSTPTHSPSPTPSTPPAPSPTPSTTTPTSPSPTAPTPS